MSRPHHRPPGPRSGRRVKTPRSTSSIDPRLYRAWLFLKLVFLVLLPVVLIAVVATWIRKPVYHPFLVAIVILLFLLNLAIKTLPKWLQSLIKRYTRALWRSITNLKNSFGQSGLRH